MKATCVSITAVQGGKRWAFCWYLTICVCVCPGVAGLGYLRRPSSVCEEEESNVTSSFRADPSSRDPPVREPQLQSTVLPWSMVCAHVLLPSHLLQHIEPSSAHFGQNAIQRSPENHYNSAAHQFPKCRLWGLTHNLKRQKWLMTQCTIWAFITKNIYLESSMPVTFFDASFQYCNRIKITHIFPACISICAVGEVIFHACRLFTLRPM